MKKIIFANCLLFVILFCSSVAVKANTVSFDSLYDGITKEQGGAIINELKQIRGLLNEIDKKLTKPKRKKRKAPPKTASISISGLHIIGDPKAPVTLIEFGDYQCPFCVKFAKKVYPKLKKEYIDTGKLRVVVRSMPLSFHKFARKAAQATYCAGEQGKFEEMHEKLFARSPKLGENFLISYAKRLALDVDTFKACIDSPLSLKKVRKDSRDAKKAGINSIPAFIIGRTEKNDKVFGLLVVGAKPFPVFQKHIEKLLKGSK